MEQVAQMRGATAKAEGCLQILDVSFVFGSFRMQDENLCFRML